MKFLGINYDVGRKTVAGGITRKTFDLDVVTREIEIIKNELHCNAIRISGEDTERIANAAEIALKQGLAVWFSASLQYDSRENTLRHIIQSARAAEILRCQYKNVIFVTECELTLFTGGFIAGNTGEERTKKMFSPFSILKNLIGIPRTYNTMLNKFLKKAVEEIRKNFKGQVTYASGTWEKVNWDLFDIVGVDYYRSLFNKQTYLKELRNYIAIGKPLCIMEFGCCTYKGAEDKGAMGWTIVDWKKVPPELKGSYVRDEDIQADCLLELLNIYDKENVFASFVFTFCGYNYVYDDNPRCDLDMASFGVVKVTEDKHPEEYKNLPWVPKKAFYKLSEYFAGL